MNATQILYLLISFVLLIAVLTTIFNFFGIGFATYGNYLLWVIALTIFFLILPKKAGTLFL
jgi:hypothetical protein